MITAEATSDRYSLLAPGVAWSFLWTEDRWVERIDLIDPGRDSTDDLLDRSPLVKTVAGSIGTALGDERALPSFQQLNLHPDPALGDRAEPPAILCVGQTGTAHDSASFRLGPDESGRSVQAVADLARRVTSGPMPFARLHAVGLPPAAIVRLGDDRRTMTWQAAGLGTEASIRGQLRILVESPDGSADPRLDGLEAGPHASFVLVQDVAEGEPPATRRLRVTWTWTPQ